MRAPRGRLLVPGLLALGLLGVLAASSGAGAAVEGEVRYDLVEPGETEIEADLELTGEEARELRDRVDRDDSGDVGALEAAGARSVLADRLEGPTETYTMDGNAYENDDASVDTDGLAGPVDSRAPLALAIEAEARVEPGSAPHVFAVHGLPGNLTDDANLTYVVNAPEGYAIADAEGFATVEACVARSEPGVDEASVELEARAEACERPVPAPGVGVALAIAAAAVVARGGRRASSTPNSESASPRSLFDPWNPSSSVSPSRGPSSST